MKQRTISPDKAVASQEAQNKRLNKKYIKRCLEWSHILLIFSMLTPLIYIVDANMVPGQIYPIYFAGYLLILPIIGLLTASKVCKNFFQYFAIIVCIVFIVKVTAQILANIVLNENVVEMYTVCMILCTVVIAAGAFATRMYKIRKKEAMENQDSTWSEDGFQLDKPAKGYCVLFFIIYVIGLFRISPQLCNLAIYNMLAYMLITISYDYINAMKSYIKLNESMCQVRNIPYKRINGIGNLFFAAYLFLLFLAVVPAFLTADKREYIKFQKSDQKIEIPAQDLDIYVQPPIEASVDQTFTEVEIKPFIPLEIIPFLEAFVLIIGLVIMVSVFFAVILAIRNGLAEFAKASEEDDDVVEVLEPLEENEQLFKAKRRFWRTKEDKMRWLYRKFIRKHRKELPAIYETPKEIEMAAGVADTEEGKAIHEKYEQVRYGK